MGNSWLGGIVGRLENQKTNMGTGCHKLLLHGIDTLQCAYYLHQEQKKDLDFGQLVQAREDLRHLGVRDGKPIRLGGVDFLLHPHGTAPDFRCCLAAKILRSNAVNSMSLRSM